MSAAPSDKSHGHRRFRPTRQEGSGRPLSASPGDRRSWDSAYQPSPTGDQVTNRRPNSASVVESSSRFWYSTTEEDAGDDTKSNPPDADSDRPEEGDSDSNYDNDKQIRVTEVDEDEDNDVNIESGGSYGALVGTRTGGRSQPRQVLTTATFALHGLTIWRLRWRPAPATGDG